MANWINTVSDRWLKSIYERLRQNLLDSSEYSHMDETTIQVNKEKDKAPSSKSYMWVMCTGEYEKRQGVIFKYSRTRKSDNAIEMLDDYTGTLSRGLCQGSDQGDGDIVITHKSADDRNLLTCIII